MKYLFILLTVATVQSATLSVLEANNIANAIYIAEGKDKTKYPYGIISVKTSNPRQVCLNTINNNYRRWQTAGRTNCYFSFLANKYAPIGAKNDPSGLNRNWQKNVKQLLGAEFVKKINSKKD